MSPSPTPTYQRLIVQGLFGSVTHDISFNRESHVTILACLNGCGKTHVLKLYRALLGLDFRILMSSPYSCVSITLIDGSEFSAERIEEEERVLLDLRGVGASGSRNHARFSSLDFVAEGTEEDLPSYIHQTQDGRWFDARMGRYMSPLYIQQRFHVQVSAETSLSKTISDHPWLANFLPHEAPILIDTKRLDTSFYVPPSRNVNVAEPTLGTGIRGGAARSGAAGRIGEYIDRSESDHRGPSRVATKVTRSRREICGNPP